MALIIATFSIFAMPASADIDMTDEPVMIEPGDTINAYERYCEFQLNLPQAGLYTFPLSTYGGYHILQTFGCSTRTDFQLLNSNGIVLISSNTTLQKGYNNNAFLHYDFSAATYTLKIRVREASPIRLSITRATDIAAANSTLPMTCFEDIVVAYSVTRRFYADSPAVVFRYIPDETQTRIIELSGSSTIRVYLMDPSSKTAFDEIVVSGEGTYTTPTLYAGRPYYVVMYQPIGPNGDLPSIDVDYIEGSVWIG